MPVGLFSYNWKGERQTEEVEEITDPEKLRRIFQVRTGTVLTNGTCIMYGRSGGLTVMRETLWDGP